jgi:hypothetical protein
LVDRIVGEEGTVGTEDDVAKKRLKIERGEYERELEMLRKENDLLKKENDQLKKERRRKSVDTEKGERLYNTLDRHFSPRLDKEGEGEGKQSDARRKLSWDLDRDKTEGVSDGGKHVSIDTRSKLIGEREDILTDKDEPGASVDKSVERRRWDMEREIEMEKWKKQGQLEKDHERSRWKMEKDKELERLKKYQELEKVSFHSSNHN